MEEDGKQKMDDFFSKTTEAVTTCILTSPSFRPVRDALEEVEGEGEKEVEEEGRWGLEALF